MSERETRQLSVLEQVRCGALTQVQASVELSLTTRQIRRLLRRYEQGGAQALVHGLRGRASNRRTPEAILAQAQALIAAHYSDFGPTLACEKLAERHGIRLSIESVRRVMTQAGLWRPRARRYKPIHPLRARRPCRGELIQIDGSPHDWFEGRAPRCTLLVFIDDATSELMALRFVEQETTMGYLGLLHDYIAQHGLPACLYSDRHSIFVTSKGADALEHGPKPTHFAQALGRLGIEALQASSPQAKGRVERANQTLQDRLVKEMRLAGLSDMASANAWLEGFRLAHNRRFAVTPSSPHDAHVAYLGEPDALAQACSVRHQRKLSKTLSCQFERRFFQVLAPTRQRELAGKQVEIVLLPQGEIRVMHREERLKFHVGVTPDKVPLDSKNLNNVVEKALLTRARVSKPKPNHPWKAWTGAEPNPMRHVSA